MSEAHMQETLLNYATGGMANTYKPTDEELQAAKSHNEKVRRESFHRGGSQDRGTIRALADKAKEAVTGKQGGDK